MGQGQTQNILMDYQAHAKQAKNMGCKFGGKDRTRNGVVVFGNLYIL